METEEGPERWDAAALMMEEGAIGRKMWAPVGVVRGKEIDSPLKGTQP